MTASIWSATLKAQDCRYTDISWVIIRSAQLPLSHAALITTDGQNLKELLDS